MTVSVVEGLAIAGVAALLTWALVAFTLPWLLRRRGLGPSGGLPLEERGALYRAARSVTEPDELRRDKRIVIVDDEGDVVGRALADAGFLRVQRWQEQQPDLWEQLQQADLVVLNGHRGARSDEVILRSEQRWVVVFSRERFDSPHFQRCAPANNELTLIGHCETALRALSYKGR
ncbi:MAG: hypothetical protein H6741_30505 [Alphaproteobacteria bacterium]|nr:hypothetical protein [Alphaproteobacteria bacterium]